MKINRIIEGAGRATFMATLMALGLTAGAEVKMPAFFSDNMVVQRDTQGKLWGEATSGAKVTVSPSWTTDSYTAKCDKDGHWNITFPTPAAGGPYEITVSDGTPVTLANVMVGEVWICSGQSNMEMPMKGFKNQPVDGANIATMESTNPDLRLFTVKRKSSATPQTDVTGSWHEACPESVREFSATAYFFGRRIQQLLGVPVGLIVTAWGGSACEAWMSDEMLAAFPEAAARIPATDDDIPSKNRTPSVLFKGMLNPFIGLPVQGVIWYQGEDNWNRAHSYADMFSTMIKGWRNLWGQGDFPFYYCQIAPYDYSIITQPGEIIYNTAYLREAQSKVENMVPNTGMAVLMDAGFIEGIHPSNKQAAGDRLAMLALGKTYGVKGIGCESPVYSGMEVKGDTVVVSFDRDKEWICGNHSFESQQFELAGEDQVFHPAKAWISRSKVMVKSDEVPRPVAVRYAFSNTSVGDLFSTDGLPVSSFRSDDWPDPQEIKQ